MPIQVIMPQLGESVIEGTVTKWLKSPGEKVDEHEPLLEINTDKVDTEIPSPETGILLEIRVPEGTTVNAGTVLALIAGPGETYQEAELAGEGQKQPAAGAVQPPLKEKSSSRPFQAANEGQESAIPTTNQDRDLGFISPVVAKIAQEYQLDLYQVEGTGLGGRITKKDVLAYLENRSIAQPEAGKAPLREPALSGTTVPPPQPAQDPSLFGESALSPGDEILPLTPVRRLIADHMLVSMRTSPHVTTVMEADLSRVVAHREANKAAFERDGTRLTFTVYFMAAAITALKAYPIGNASWSDAGILLHRQINIGIATSLGEEGLIVPVLKNADSLSLLGIAQSVNDLANRARAHKLRPDEVKGGTFTITNHGTSGSLFATPIINQPQAAILGVGAIQKRVVVIEGPETGDTIAIRPMVYLSLTFDHRILDGAVGNEILRKVVETLENWK